MPLRYICVETLSRALFVFANISPLIPHNTQSAPKNYTNHDCDENRVTNQYIFVAVNFTVFRFFALSLVFTFGAENG